MAASLPANVRGPVAAVALAALAIILTWSASARAGSLVREGGRRSVTATAAEARTGITLPDVLIVAESDSVWLGGALLPREDYGLDHGTGVLTLVTDAPDTALVTVTYRYLPLDIERTYRSAVLESLAALPPGFTGDAVMVALPGEEPAESALAHGLRVGGAKTFGITVGSNRDPSLEQSLRMNISGRVTRDVSVNAYLSDQNTPLVPEGDTEELRALDKVLIQVESENLSATMGDYELRIDGGPLANLRREETGAMATASLGSADLVLAGARSAGSFASMTFRGTDGKQGPYLLTDEAGATGITVVAGSERVWLNGQRMTRGRDNDYVIDYADGALEFTERRPIRAESEVTVDYEFSSGDYDRDTYAGRITLAGRADGSLIGVSFFREADDREASTSALGEAQLALLEAAGDDPELAHDDGVDSVGVGLGDYEWVGEGVFEYAGPDSGSYDLFFEREDGGDYVYDYFKGYYTYVGEGAGDFRLGRDLALPTDHGLVAADGRLELPRGGHVSATAAVSSFDANTYSDLDEDDNLGNAQIVDAAMPALEFSAFGGSELGLAVQARRVSGRFRGVGRYRETGYVERWELDGLELPEGELLLEGRSSVKLGSGGGAEVSYAWLERGDALESARTEFRVEGRPGDGSRFWANGRFVDHRSTDVADTLGGRKRSFYRGGFEQAIGLVRPGVSYAHDERTSGATGERYDEYGASVENARGAVSFGASYSHRLTDRDEGGGWVDASTTRTQEYRVGVQNWDKLRVEGSVSRREVEFEEGFAGTGTRHDLASVRLNHTSLDGGLTGEVRYSVTSTEVEEKERFVIEEDGIEITRTVGTGRYLPVTDLTAATRWKFKPGSRGKGGRSLPDPTPLGRFLSSMTFTTDVKLREMTTTDDRASLYMLDPGVLQGDDTVRGEITGRHVVRYLAPNSSVSVRLAVVTRDALDRSYTNDSTRRTERAGTADIKLSRTGGATYRLQGDVGRRERDATGSDSYDIDEMSLLAEAGLRDLGDVEVKLTASAGRQDETLEAIEVVVLKVTPSVTYRLAGRGAMTASVTRIDVEATGGSLADTPYLAEGRRAGATTEWRVGGDYRFNRFITGSFSYSGEARPDAEAVHTLDVRVNAFF